MHSVSLVAGQKVSANFCAKLVQGDYTWRWLTEIEALGSETTTIKFDQSKFAGMMLSPEKLQKSASTYSPALSEEGLVDRRVLELMDGKTSPEEIARKITVEFPQRFARWQDALGFAAEISTKYGI